MFLAWKIFSTLNDHAAMREQLCASTTRIHLTAIEERTHSHEHHRALFNGIQRFLFEDRIAIDIERAELRCGTNARIVPTA